MKNFILFLCLCGASVLQAQQFNVKLSEKVKLDREFLKCHRYDKHLVSTKVEVDEIQVAYTASAKKQNYDVEIIQYDEQFNELKKLSLDSNKKLFAPFEPIVHYGEKAIYVLYSKFTGEGKLGLFVTKIDPHTLAIVANKEVASYDQKNKHFIGLWKMLLETQMLLKVSSDGHYAWIVNSSPKLLISTVVDNNLDIVQEAQSIPILQTEFKVTGLQICNDGYQVLTYQQDNPGKQTKYTYGLLFQPLHGTHTFQTIEFPGGQFPGALDLLESKDGQTLYMGGEYYQDRKTYSGTGIFLASLDVKKQSIQKQAFYPYTAEMKDQVRAVGFADKQLDFKDRDLDYKMFELSTGTIVLSADMHFSVTKTVYSGGNNPFPRTVVENLTGPIIHAFVSKDGKANLAVIKKAQHEDIFTGYFNYVYNDKLICLYGDLAKNAKNQSGEVKQALSMRDSDDLIPVANVYNEEGKLLQKKMLVEDEDDMEGNVMFKNISNLGNNQMILPIGKFLYNFGIQKHRLRQLCFLDIK